MANNFKDELLDYTNKIETKILQTKYALQACAEVSGFMPYEWRQYPHSDGRWQLWHGEKVIAEMRLAVSNHAVKVSGKWCASPPSANPQKPENSQDS